MSNDKLTIKTKLKKMHIYTAKVFFIFFVVEFVFRVKKKHAKCKTLSMRCFVRQ